MNDGRYWNPGESALHFGSDQQNILEENLSKSLTLVDEVESHARDFKKSMDEMGFKSTELSQPDVFQEYDFGPTHRLNKAIEADYNRNVDSLVKAIADAGVFGPAVDQLPEDKDEKAKRVSKKAGENLDPPLEPAQGPTRYPVQMDSEVLNVPNAQGTKARQQVQLADRPSNIMKVKELGASPEIKRDRADNEKTGDGKAKVPGMMKSNGSLYKSISALKLAARGKC